jgi:hypothetical protein
MPEPVPPTVATPPLAATVNTPTERSAHVPFSGTVTLGDVNSPILVSTLHSARDADATTGRRRRAVTAPTVESAPPLPGEPTERARRDDAGSFAERPSDAPATEIDPPRKK